MAVKEIEKTVFISYRRTNFSWAVAIYQSLNYNGYDVFLDYTGIASGGFWRVILENIAARAHFVIVLTPSALERCGDPEDWLRREIEAALAARRNIVPVMLDGFDFDTPAIASQLTGELTVLKDYNALSVPPPYFAEAMERLQSRYLNVSVDAVLHPMSLSAQRAAVEQKAAADAAPAVLEKELTAEQWFERGVGTTDVDEKLRFYDEAIKLNPRSYTALANRGLARRDKGDFEGAIKDCNEAIQLKPDDPEAFYCRGNVRAKYHDLKGAMQDYSEAILLKPDFAPALNNPDYKKAIQAGYKPLSARAELERLRQVLPDQTRSLGPDHLDTLSTREEIAWWTAETGDARAALDLLQELLPDVTRVLGPDHLHTLSVREEIALLTRKTGAARAALDLFQELL